MTDNIAGLIEELCRLIKDPAVDVALSPVLMAAMKQLRALAQENERLQDAIEEPNDVVAELNQRIRELEAERDSLQHQLNAVWFES